MRKSLILLAASLCVLNAGYIKEALNAKDDHNKLAQIYEDACDKEKKASGCYNLAVLYSRGDGNVKRTRQRQLCFMKRLVIKISLWLAATLVMSMKMAKA